MSYVLCLKTEVNISVIILFLPAENVMDESRELYIVHTASSQLPTIFPERRWWEKLVGNVVEEKNKKYGLWEWGKKNSLDVHAILGKL